MSLPAAVGEQFAYTHQRYAVGEELVEVVLAGQVVGVVRAGELLG